MGLFLSIIFFAYYILEYVKNKKGYALLGGFICFFTIIFRLPYLNNMIETNYLIFKYGTLVVVIPFLFLFIKDKLMLLKHSVR